MSESVLPIEAVLRRLERCIELGGMTYHGDDLGVLAAGIVNALCLVRVEEVGFKYHSGRENDPTYYLIGEDSIVRPFASWPTYTVGAVTGSRDGES